jgi:NAD(P)H-dependent FMN reductase
MPLKIAVILGSTRPNRFGEKPVQWILDEVKKLKDVEATFLDLRDHPLPFFDQGSSPSGVKDGNYGNPAVNAWAKEIAGADAFVMVSPEYNHSTSAVLKNALDSVYAEWNNKAVGFVSYGGVGGARAVEHLRGIAVELQMAPVRNAVHIPGSVVWGGTWKPLEDQSLMKQSHGMLVQLQWWGNALKAAREKK